MFCEKDPERSQQLYGLQQEYPGRDITIVNQDANDMIPGFCRSLRRYDRAVVFLDPFATEVSWSTVAAIAETQKIDSWILFPLAAIARMMPRDDEPSEALANQLDRIFGGRQHWEDFYRPSPQLPLFGDTPSLERLSGSQQIADRFRQRLGDVFSEIAPTRRTFANSRNVPLFDLFFAASNPVGARRAIPIADHILKNW